VNPEQDSAERTFEGTSAIPESASCAIKLPLFEGPLDLLLHLIRINEVDIADIPIATISQQYLEYLEIMRSLDIDVAAEYLVMAATLAHIKSRMLLPTPEGEEEDEIDPRAELARRLAEYAVFKEAAEELGRRPILGRDVFPGAVDPGSMPERETSLSVSLFDLLEGLRRALAQVPVEAPHHAVTLERVTLQDRMVHVMDRLRGAEEGALLFEDLLLDAPLSRHRIVVTFLAILELAKMQAVRLFQNQTEGGQPFGPVRVRLAVEISEDSSSEAEESDG
jgi:segregation and condensation protein A